MAPPQVDTPASDRFRQRLRHILVERGMSQSDLAKAMQTSDAHVSQILSGRRVPRLTLIDRISKALEVDCSEFFSE